MCFAPPEDVERRWVVAVTAVEKEEEEEMLVLQVPTFRSFLSHFRFVYFGTCYVGENERKHALFIFFSSFASV